METVFVGRNLIFLPEVDSTNSYAIHLLKKVKLNEGTVIYSDNQTQGKGQRGSSWNSQPASNLTMSVVLFPRFLNLEFRFYLYKIAALACYDTISELLNSSQFDIKIKWPNDILVNRKKICGILIENNLIESHFNSSVIGIGVNVNQNKFSEEFKATSIQLETGQTHSTKEIMGMVCTHLEKYYNLLKSDKTQIIQSQYLKNLFSKDNWMDFEMDKRRIKLKVKGISQSGLLILEDENGLLIEVDVKEIKWLY